ncbi:glycosyltransferase family 4 protein [Corynebacterium tuberculostearicum]|uniref:glycosyltransferase family 4 protein n=1 Tax=Corynebacterium tuberculostearicum TaxID=38304 RepID=UPI00293471DA|nr:glycosyltransferase family 4 protein [Corynebacterium tuberculostearicum]MDV2431445.1 glycosyltransferase family 4 protein [Corynebacterium tuberculostearicum]
MRIVIFSQYWIPENGVPQRRWKWLAEVLKEHGHDLLVVAPPPHYARKVSLSCWIRQRGYRSSRSLEQGECGENILRTGYFPAGRSLTQRVLNQSAVALAGLFVLLTRRDVLKNFSPDLIIGTVPSLPTAFVAAVAGKASKLPYILDLRDAWPELLHDWEKWNDDLGVPSFRQKLLAFGPAQLVTPVVEFVLNRCFEGAHGILTTSSRLGASLVDKGYVEDDTQTKTVRNVFPMESEWKPSSRKKRRGELNILYAGTIGRAQQLSNALSAIEILKRRGLSVSMRIIGEGAAKKNLTKIVEARNLPVDFLPRVTADALSEHYAWADTALVHLADWGPLRMAIPSKTYELMEQKIHISGVIDGEAAELIEQTQAGFVVQPNSPEELANAWNVLAAGTEVPRGSNRASEWVKNERENRSPGAFFELLERVIDRER